jgi:hypothetical protein
MSGSPAVVDYGRFAERLAAAREAAAADPAHRWDLYHDFHAEWVQFPARTRNTDYPLRVFGRTREAVENLLERLGGDWAVAEPEESPETPEGPDTPDAPDVTDAAERDR